jgi:uncharacterized membrane protein
MLTHTRAEMKQAAKSTLEGKWGLVICALLLAELVPGVVLGIALGSMGTMGSLTMALGAIGSAIIIWALFYVLEIAFIFFIYGPLMFSYQMFYLRFSRGLEVKATTPYQCFSGENYGRLTLGFFMQFLFTFLWALLFYVPGIIKALSYSMMPYIMMDRPDANWQVAINESKQMMHGHKADLFVLYLSFIPWLLLVSVTFGIAWLYVGPYMYTTVANFYRSIKAENIAVAKQELPNQFTA